MGKASAVTADTVRVATHAAIAQLKARKLESAAFLLPKLALGKVATLHSIFRTVRFQCKTASHARGNALMIA